MEHKVLSCHQQGRVTDVTSAMTSRRGAGSKQEHMEGVVGLCIGDDQRS